MIFWVIFSINPRPVNPKTQINFLLEYYSWQLNSGWRWLIGWSVKDLLNLMCRMSSLCWMLKRLYWQSGTEKLLGVVLSNAIKIKKIFLSFPWASTKVKKFLIMIKWALGITKVKVNSFLDFFLPYTLVVKNIFKL